MLISSADLILKPKKRIGLIVGVEGHHVDRDDVCH
jgi:hypothetical protein